MTVSNTATNMAQTSNRSPRASQNEMKENVLKKQPNTNLTTEDISVNAGNVSMAGVLNDDDSSFSELKTPTGQAYITPTQPNLGSHAQTKKLG